METGKKRPLAVGDRGRCYGAWWKISPEETGYYTLMQELPAKLVEFVSISQEMIEVELEDGSQWRGHPCQFKRFKKKARVEWKSVGWCNIYSLNPNGYNVAIHRTKDCAMGVRPNDSRRCVEVFERVEVNK